MVIEDHKVTPDDPIFKEVMNRNPDVSLKNRNGQTATQSLQGLIRSVEADKFPEFKPYLENMRKKLSIATQNELRYKDAVKGAIGMKTVSTLGLPQDIEENVISEYLTGEKGNPSVVLSKLRVKTGRSGVPTKGGKKSKRKTRKVKRRRL